MQWVPGRGEDRGEAIPTVDHPPRNILMRASVRKPGEVQGVTPSEKPGEWERARLIAGELRQNGTKRSSPNDPDPTDDAWS